MTSDPMQPDLSERRSGTAPGASPCRIAILGGRGAGEIAADIAARQAGAGKLVEVVGYLNDFVAVGQQLLGGKVIGRFDRWQELADDVRFVAPLHKAKASAERMERFASLGIPNERLATLVDPMAIIAPGTKLAPGSLIGAFAVAGPSVSIGHLVSLWPAAQLGHDVQVEDFVFVGRAAVISGYCTLASGAYVGPGAVVLEGCRVGRLAVVGAGAVVSRDVPDGAIVAGNPARAVPGLHR